MIRTTKITTSQKIVTVKKGVTKITTKYGTRTVVKKEGTSKDERLNLINQFKSMLYENSQKFSGNCCNPLCMRENSTIVISCPCGRTVNVRVTSILSKEDVFSEFFDAHDEIQDGDRDDVN
jgi:transcription elongation factor Elf1